MFNNQKKSLYMVIVLFQLLTIIPVHAETPGIQALIKEAINNNPEIQALELKTKAAGLRISQEKSLPDPMFMIGYQNEGFKELNLGTAPDSELMFSLSQTFIAWGITELKGRMAEVERQSFEYSLDNLRLQTATNLTELYFDLFLVNKQREIIQSKKDLFAKIEQLALSRYASNAGKQEEVLMAQVEQYMLQEQLEMLTQANQAKNAMLQAALGRDNTTDNIISVPVDITAVNESEENLMQQAFSNAPMLKEKQSMVEFGLLKAEMSRRDYYADFTVNAGYVYKGSMDPMWNLSVAFPLPLYANNKQDAAVKETGLDVERAKKEFDAARIMIRAGIKDNMSMITASEKLMILYKKGLIPKNRQSFDLMLSGYSTGMTDAITIISTLKRQKDYEEQYWVQFVQHEKAIAKIKELAGLL